MNTKILLSLLGVILIAIVILSIKVLTSSESSSTNASGGAGISLITKPNPLRTGPATFMIDVKDKNGNPVDKAKVSFNFDMTSMDMGTQQGEAKSQGNGRYSAQGSTSMPGPWRLTAKVTMPDGSVENKEFTLDVQ